MCKLREMPKKAVDYKEKKGEKRSLRVDEERNKEK